MSVVIQIQTSQWHPVAGFEMSSVERFKWSPSPSSSPFGNMLMNVKKNVVEIFGFMRCGHMLREGTSILAVMRTRSKTMQPGLFFCPKEPRSLRQAKDLLVQ